MNKYEEIKSAAENEIKAIAENDEKYKSAMEPSYRTSSSIASPIIKEELNSIGRTFFGGGFWSKKYRIQDYRFKNGRMGHMWVLDRLLDDNYVPVIMVSMDHDEKLKYSLKIERNNASYSGVEPSIWFKVVTELGGVINAINQKL